MYRKNKMLLFFFNKTMKNIVTETKLVLYFHFFFCETNAWFGCDPY